MQLLHLLACALAFVQPPQPDKLYAATAAGIGVRVISVDLADPRVRISVQTTPAGQAEPFDSLIARSRPTIAINGAYFSKTSLAPIGDIVCAGRLVRKGMMGTALAVTRDNVAVIRRVKWGHAEDWSEYETVLGCGPTLVLNGRIDVQPEAEGFRDPHVMGSTKRMGVGLTSDRRMLIVTTQSAVTFRKWAEVMQALGCEIAMNLDAGASLAMHYRGRTLMRPGRNLTNLLLVHVSDKADLPRMNANTRE
jgi:uncharacterized protein YigE (DUF2233 family)